MKDIDVGQSFLRARFQPCATYFFNSDCVEYVKEDALCVYDRVDAFLTLIYDETMINLIGFKLKGFKFLFEKHLKPLYLFNDMQFIDLVPAFEAVIGELGDAMLGEPRRVAAYKAVYKLAANDNVRLTNFRMAA